ncbi:hypothetical protein PoB_003716800 [Plakobranchus ocellatus]|uniref:Uncharacterized protein n=1 Tax=Plakobranchus ocellatus TaxID=259542 RepID=A0AAV4AVX0_9GAST|nr:hypothetical protein PoB_003716800 [Plakobranchus ocellatus]
METTLTIATTTETTTAITNTTTTTTTITATAITTVTSCRSLSTLLNSCCHQRYSRQGLFLGLSIFNCSRCYYYRPTVCNRFPLHCTNSRSV